MSVDMSTPTLALTFGDNARARDWQTKVLPWPEVVILLKNHQEGNKDGQGVVFGALESDGPRRNERITERSALALDLDNGTPKEVVRDAMRAAGWACAAHTTHSSTPEHQKWRVVIPLARPVRRGDFPNQEEFANYWRRLNHAIAAKLGLDADPSCSDLARLVYLPRHLPGAAYKVASLDGPFLDPGEIEVPDMEVPAHRPESAKPATGTTAYGRAALEGECGKVALAPEGQRNATLNTAAFAAGQLVAAGHVGRGEAEHALAHAADRAGLPRGEAWKTICSGLEAGARKPREPKTQSAPVPFDNYAPPAIPQGAVPGVLRDFSLALAESIQVPFELALCNVLGAVAAVAQRKFRVVEIRPGYSESLNLYALCPLPPGERKSAVVEACKRPLVEWQAAKRREMEGVIRGARSERLTLEKAIETKRSAAAKTKDAEARRAAIEEIKEMEQELPEVPEAPRLLADDFTPEALAVLMARHDQRIALLEAEGGLFDTLAGRYSNGVPNLDAVLKFWAGEACQIDRRSRDSIFLDDPHLTLVISPQPTVVQGLAGHPGFRGRGLVGRFLYFMPQSRLGSRAVESSPMPPGVAATYYEMIHRLLSAPWAQDEHGQKTAYGIRLEPGAYALWRPFAEAVEAGLRPGGEFDHMTDWAGKFIGQAARLAGLFHVATVPEPQRTAIGEDTMRSALDVAAVLAEHAKAAYGLMGSDPAQECAKAILGWMLRERREAFTARDALRAVRGRYPTMEKVRPGLTLLEERAYIFPTDGQDGRGPGRKPSTPYTVNPLTWEASK